MFRFQLADEQMSRDMSFPVGLTPSICVSALQVIFHQANVIIAVFDMLSQNSPNFKFPKPKLLNLSERLCEHQMYSKTKIEQMLSWES